MRRLYALALLGPLACTHRGVPSGTAAPPLRLALVWLAGQSNMSGRGVPELLDTTPVPNVWALDSTGHWRPAREPLHWEKPKLVGTGPGFAFARAIARECHVAIGLVPTAVGGSAIRRWEPAAFDSATNTHPWDDAMSRIARARPDGRFVAILWHQGESDANPQQAPLYDGRLRDLIRRMRSAVGNPDAPFVMGGIGRWPERPWNAYREKVDSVQRDVARTTPRTAFVPSDGLRHRGDSLHFDAASQREFGERYAKALLSMSGCGALRP